MSSEKRRDRTLNKKWGISDSNNIICHKTKRFESMIVCASNCMTRCNLFKRFFNIKILLDFVEQHPEYEIIGEIMQEAKGTKKTGKTAGKPQQKIEKLFWVITEGNFVEVTESELLNNPIPYLDKLIVEKPRGEFELIVTLKKKSSK
ncbi:MAG: hypothetical protein RBS16_05925 [Candidatus Cloacimonadales bacterium]|jgi:hypothetical protein|nr:hypothetical protein [Candidatus Cloacimonadales bacterium]